MADRSTSKRISNVETPGSSGRRRSSFGDAPPTPAPTPTPITTPPPPPQRTAVRDHNVPVDERKRQSDAARKRKPSTPAPLEANDQLVVEENVQQPKGSSPKQSPRLDVVEENVLEQPEDSGDGGIRVDKEVEEEQEQEQPDVEDLMEAEVPEEDAEQVLEVSDEELQQSEVEESVEGSEQQKDVEEDVHENLESTDDGIETTEDDIVENDEEDMVIVPEQSKEEEVMTTAGAKQVTEATQEIPADIIIDKDATKKIEKKASLKTDERDAKAAVENAEKDIRKEKKPSPRAVEKGHDIETRETRSPRKDAERETRKEKKTSVRAIEKENEREARSPRKDSARTEKKASLKTVDKENETQERSPRKSKKGSIRAIESRREAVDRKEISTLAGEKETVSEQHLKVVGERMQGRSSARWLCGEARIDGSSPSPQVVGHEKCVQALQGQQLSSVPPIRVSVLYNESDGKVLFLEGGKDFVDLLLNFLMLPLGTVVKLLNNSKGDLAALGAVVRLFQSVEKLEPSIMVVDKDVLMIPKSEQESTHQIERPLAPQLESGYVSENLTFTITDELEVFPTSTIKSIALLNELQVTNMADLKSMEVCIDTTDVLRLLRASLTQKSVLNYVFQCRLPIQHQHDRCDRCSVHCK